MIDQVMKFISKAIDIANMNGVIIHLEWDNIQKIVEIEYSIFCEYNPRSEKIYIAASEINGDGTVDTKILSSLYQAIQKIKYD